jgi:hypothetical protein
MVNFLLEGGRKARVQLVEVPAARVREPSELALARGLETVDGSMMTSIIKHVKCWMVIDINV